MKYIGFWQAKPLILQGQKYQQRKNLLTIVLALHFFYAPET